MSEGNVYSENISFNWSNLFSNLVIIIIISSIVILVIRTDIFGNLFKDLFKVRDEEIENRLIISKEIMSYGEINFIRISKPTRFRSTDNISKKSINIDKINIYDKANDLVFTKSDINITTDSIEIPLEKFVNIKKLEIFPCKKDDVVTCYTCSINKCGIETKIDLKKITYESPIYSIYNACVMESCQTECSKCLNDMVGVEITLIGVENNQRVDRLKYKIPIGDFVHELII